jgi:hypothetical protein
VLASVRELSLADQQRLRQALAQLTATQIDPPRASASARRKGQQLAKTVRTQLADAPTGKLDDVMRGLRGRSWS